MSLATGLALLGGIGVGWIACHYFVVRYLIWTVRDMRKQGFVYDAPMPKHEEQPDLFVPEANET